MQPTCFNDFVPEREQVIPERFNPCGYCRRCAIHDDPAGCLEVEAFEARALRARIGAARCRK